jgi:hypothetical protein
VQSNVRGCHNLTVSNAYSRTLKEEYRESSSNLT